MIVHKLLDHFLLNLQANEKQEVYQLALQDTQSALARLAVLYERLFCDYPTGSMAHALEQHLEDKIFQLRQKQLQSHIVA